VSARAGVVDSACAKAGPAFDLAILQAVDLSKGPRTGVVFDGSMFDTSLCQALLKASETAGAAGDEDDDRPPFMLPLVGGPPELAGLFQQMFSEENVMQTFEHMFKEGGFMKVVDL
jgi:hypothetical protein